MHEAIREHRRGGEQQSDGLVAMEGSSLQIAAGVLFPMNIMRLELRFHLRNSISLWLCS